MTFCYFTEERYLLLFMLFLCSVLLSLKLHAHLPVYVYSLMHCGFVIFLAVSPDSKQMNSAERNLAIYWDLGYPQRVKMTAAFFILYWVFQLFLQVPGDMLRKAIGFSFSQSAYKSEDRFCKSLVRWFCFSCSMFSPIFFLCSQAFK